MPILSAIYTQSVYTKIVIKNLYASSLLLFVHRHLHNITFISVHSVTLCAILFEGLSLSVHITGGANTEVYKIVYKKRDYLRKGNPVNYCNLGLFNVIRILLPTNGKVIMQKLITSLDKNLLT